MKANSSACVTFNLYNVAPLNEAIFPLLHASLSSTQRRTKVPEALCVVCGGATRPSVPPESRRT